MKPPVMPALTAASDAKDLLHLLAAGCVPERPPPRCTITSAIGVRPDDIALSGSRDLIRSGSRDLIRISEMDIRQIARVATPL